MMSQVIHHETIVFLLSVFHGIGLSVIYDCLRAARRVWGHNLTAVTIEDFLFCVTASFLTFCLLFFNTKGVLRGYVFVGIAIGVILYHFTVSRTVITAIIVPLRGIRWCFCMITGKWCIILKKNSRFFKKRIEFVKKTVYNVNKIDNKG